MLANIESGPLQYEAGTPAVAVLGRLYVDRGESVWLVLDIALLPEHRRTGIGTRLLTEILAEAAAAGKPVQIHVERFNPARHHHENPQRSESRANGRLPQSDAMPAQAIS